MARKCLLTPEVQSAIVGAIEKGATRREAALAAGISETTLYRWLARGEKAQKGQFREFYEAVKQAEEKAVLGFVSAIWEAAQNGKWQAAAWWLERRYPEDWGKQRLVEPEGKRVSFPLPREIAEEEIEVAKEILKKLCNRNDGNGNWRDRRGFWEN